jgi:hypothetical protein
MDEEQKHNPGREFLCTWTEVLNSRRAGNFTVKNEDQPTNTERADQGKKIKDCQKPNSRGVRSSLKSHGKRSQQQQQPSLLVPSKLG